MDDYIVAYEGSESLNKPLNVVTHNLVTHLKLSESQAISLVQGPKKVLKRNLSIQDAKRYQLAFTQLGLKTYVKSLSTPAKSNTETLTLVGKPEESTPQIDQKSTRELNNDNVSHHRAGGTNDQQDTTSEKQPRASLIDSLFTASLPLMALASCGLILTISYHPFNDGVVRNGFATGVVLIIALTAFKLNRLRS